MHSETRPSCVCDLVEIHVVVLFCLTFVAIWFTHTSTKKQKKFCVTGNFGPGQYVTWRDVTWRDVTWRDVTWSAVLKVRVLRKRTDKVEVKVKVLPPFGKDPYPHVLAELYCVGWIVAWRTPLPGTNGDRQLPTWSLVLFRTILVLFPWRIYKPNLFLRLMLLKDLT